MKIPERERSGIYMTAIRLEVQWQNFTDKYLQKVSTRKERVDSKPKDVDNSGDSKKNGGKSSAKSIWKNFLQKVKAGMGFPDRKNLPENQLQKNMWIAGGCVALVILIFSLIVLLIRRRR